jgi:hypothetical protein
MFLTFEIGRDSIDKNDEDIRMAITLSEEITDVHVSQNGVRTYWNIWTSIDQLVTRLKGPSQIVWL